MVTGPPSTDELAQVREALREYLGQARAAHPAVSVPDEVFLEYLAQRANPSLPLATAVQQLSGPDLLLVCAAGRGDPAALSRLEALCLAAARRNRVSGAEPFVDELRQALMVELLVGNEGRRPKLELYSGLGMLEHWLVAVGCALALKLSRAGGPARPQDDDGLSETFELMIDWQTPELLSIRQQAHDSFKQAAQTALRSLDARERTLVRLRCVEGATDSAIAVFYRVTRASVVRWFSAIRAKLLERTRLALGAQLRPSEIDSLLRTLQGELSASLERLADER